MAHEKNTAGHAEVLMRAYLSSRHLWSARHFTLLAEKIETEHAGNKPVFNIQLHAYVVNVVFSSVAFLEAAINELYDDVVDGHPSYVDSISPEAKRLLAALWKRVERWAIIEKYQTALLLSGIQPFEPGRPPYQDAELLIKLRDQLVHAQPKTRASGDLDKFCKGLKTKFDASRLMQNAGNPYFPDKCLGAVCARWAVETAEVFADEFFRRYGLEPNYQRVDFGLR